MSLQSCKASAAEHQECNTLTKPLLSHDYLARVRVLIPICGEIYSFSVIFAQPNKVLLMLDNDVFTSSKYSFARSDNISQNSCFCVWLDKSTQSAPHSFSLGACWLYECDFRGTKCQELVLWPRGRECHIFRFGNWYRWHVSLYVIFLILGNEKLDVQKNCPALSLTYFHCADPRQGPRRIMEPWWWIWI